MKHYRVVLSLSSSIKANNVADRKESFEETNGISIQVQKIDSSGNRLLSIGEKCEGQSYHQASKIAVFVSTLSDRGDPCGISLDFEECF